MEYAAAVAVRITARSGSVRSFIAIRGASVEEGAIAAVVQQLSTLVIEIEVTVVVVVGPRRRLRGMKAQQARGLGHVLERAVAVVAQ